MAGRMSNRERIEQLRAEAAAAAREKAAARAEKAARAPAARKSSGKGAAPPARGRVRIVWNVCDPSGKEVRQFPFAQEQEARAEAAQLTTSTGRTHFVMKADVPFA
ncbi:MAG TPA: hypothetical protein VFZ65_03250 [Planctomycetota bacterium]|nr:hypothetical protein [Planctomycetota bacterium]